MMEQEYNLRKEVDELQYLAAQTQSEVSMLRAITLDGNEYYTKEEVDEELRRLRLKSEGLPYFYKNSDGDLIVDLPLNSNFSFSLNNNKDLIVSLPSGVENHFSIDEFGYLWFRSD